MNTEELEQQLEQAFRADADGNYDLAERLANAALAELSAETEPALHSDALRVLGNVEWRRGNYLLALERLTAALNSLEHITDLSRLARIQNSLGLVHKDLGSYDKALEYYSAALEANTDLGDKSRVALVKGNIGVVHQNLGSYDKALEYYGDALPVHTELGEKSGVARVNGNIGAVHFNLGSYDKALEYYGAALSAYTEIGAESHIAEVTGNIGIVHADLGSYDKALEYFGAALEAHAELGEKSAVANVTGNIGIVHQMLGSYDKALEYFGAALLAHTELGQKSGVVAVTGNMGTLYSKRDFAAYDPIKAEEFLLKAIALSYELGAKAQNVESFKSIAELYADLGEWKKAYEYFRKHHDAEKEVQSEEAKKQAMLMEQRKQIAERENEIALAKAAATAKLNATTQLLYKVLPESIATRMIDGEEQIADYYEKCSILFADIAGFTPISADMPAFMVVRFLNFVFKEFDRIIKKHGCEKVKTIGDGYMAVAGAPATCDDHAERITAAAIEMQQAIHLPDDIREYLPDGTRFGVRVGLHTGSVVAGVIGDERFVWDIYSDAVNTSARMESHGEPHKIHVTHDFVRHLQNRFSSTKNTSHGITFEKRGEVEIKGKGMMRTYFLERDAR